MYARLTRINSTPNGAISCRPPLFGVMFARVLAMAKSLFLLIFFAFSSNAVYAENKCENFISCVVMLRDKVELNTVYHEDIFGSGLSGEVRIVIDKDYSLKSATLKESSGNRQFDNSILNAVKSIKSFSFLSNLSLVEQEKLSDITLRFDAPDNKEK